MSADLRHKGKTQIFATCCTISLQLVDGPADSDVHAAPIMYIEKQLLKLLQLVYTCMHKPTIIEIG